MMIDSLLVPVSEVIRQNKDVCTINRLIAALHTWHDVDMTNIVKYAYNGHNGKIFTDYYLSRSHCVRLVQLSSGHKKTWSPLTGTTGGRFHDSM